MYYEESKKNLMALLRQQGCPSVFLTLSCAEFDWPELLKEIMETVLRKKVTKEDIEQLTPSEKNKLISDNVVQSTLHFQKRVDKMFSLMRTDFFDASKTAYHVSSYFYRIEFQQRGAPHVHSLLWLKNRENQEAPNFWFESEEKDQNKSNHDDQYKIKQEQERIFKVEEFANFLISTSSDDIKCENHKSTDDCENEPIVCKECQLLKEKVDKYQNHRHTFTCAKKMKAMRIKENEGF